MEKTELLRLANEFYSKLREIDPSVAKMTIKFDGDTEDKESLPEFRSSAELIDIKNIYCEYFPGIGVVCFP